MTLASKKHTVDTSSASIPAPRSLRRRAHDIAQVETLTLGHKSSGFRGTPMELELGTFMKPRLGHDFSQLGVSDDNNSLQNAPTSTKPGDPLLSNATMGAIDNGHVREGGAMARRGLLQRKCSCGGTPGPSGECPECEKKRNALQRKAQRPNAHPPGPSSANSMILQPKLAIGSVSDPLETEADRVAERVLSSHNDYTISSATGRVPNLSRQSRESIDYAPASVDRMLEAPGTPLEPVLQQDMEQRFGHDFSQVRIHRGAVAEQSARDVMADAYTVGHNIVFGAGQFAPTTHEGRRLIAHELTHVVQQGAAGNRLAQSHSNRPLLQRQRTRTNTSPGSINITFDPKVVSNYIWPSAWGSYGWVQSAPLGAEVLDALKQAGAVITIKFVAEMSDIPAGPGSTPQGRCESLGGRAFNIYVLAGRSVVVRGTSQYGSRTLSTRIGARPSEETAGTLFHELLHAWFQIMFPNAPITTGHTGQALPIGDPNFDASEYDPEFLSRLRRFSTQMEQLKQNMRQAASQTNPTP